MPIMMSAGEGRQEYDPGQQFIVDGDEALAELCSLGGRANPITSLYCPRLARNG